MGIGDRNITDEVDELIDLILFGDIHETGWNNLKGLIQDDLLSGKEKMDEEAKTRVAIASTIMERYA